MPKKRKSYLSVSEIGPSPLNLDRQTDGQTEGRLGIRKAPLPLGTAELKRSHETRSTGSADKGLDSLLCHYWVPQTLESAGASRL